MSQCFFGTRWRFSYLRLGFRYPSRSFVFVLCGWFDVASGTQLSVGVFVVAGLFDWIIVDSRLVLPLDILGRSYGVFSEWSIVLERDFNVGDDPM